MGPPDNGVIGGRVTKEPPKTPQKGRPSRIFTTPKAESTPKYGWCPKCKFGRKVRKTINPDNPDPEMAGKWYFACSNKETEGCELFELLQNDPMLSLPPTPLSRRRCPQCYLGFLEERCKDPFHFMERYLECSRKKALENPCMYRQDLPTPVKETVTEKPKMQPEADMRPSPYLQPEPDMQPEPEDNEDEDMLPDPVVSNTRLHDRLFSDAQYRGAAEIRRDPEGLVDLTSDDEPKQPIDLTRDESPGAPDDSSVTVEDDPDDTPPPVEYDPDDTPPPIEDEADPSVWKRLAESSSPALPSVEKDDLADKPLPSVEADEAVDDRPLSVEDEPTSIVRPLSPDYDDLDSDEERELAEMAASPVLGPVRQMSPSLSPSPIPNVLSTQELMQLAQMADDLANERAQKNTL
ncbi:hypothetical protein B0H63DRAFT_286747 [Podospora didyma]|uniref:Uncharacterized protein n=1 Tax=Podospora didyma TaxID=330526 RepID=A0AAE0K8I1_9PEZI|nr:hypothetical protein B0H63DRAFT_286747 [Podospora didyma]